jgi:plastocyanin
VFRNDDAVVHNVFSSDAAFRFNLRAQAPGASTAVAFDQPGTFHVRCAIHPNMKLDVTVAP